MKSSHTEATINIQRIDSERILIPIMGTSPLIVHKFSQKAKQQMLDNMQGRKNPKTAKDPQADYVECFYRLDDDAYGFPVCAFKAATVSAARFFGKQVSMVQLRQFVFFRGEMSNRDGQQLARIEGEPKMREDAVSVGIGGHDLRYRPEFREWSTTLDVTYVRSSLTRDSLLSLVDAGGMGVGVGDWRPEKRGEFGCYAIDESRKVEVVE